VTAAGPGRPFPAAQNVGAIALDSSWDFQPGAVICVRCGSCGELRAQYEDWLDDSERSLMTDLMAEIAGTRKWYAATERLTNAATMRWREPLGRAGRIDPDEEMPAARDCGLSDRNRWLPEHVLSLPNTRVNAASAA
jgi:hypothetical protein